MTSLGCVDVWSSYRSSSSKPSLMKRSSQNKTNSAVDQQVCNLIKPQECIQIDNAFILVLMISHSPFLIAGNRIYERCFYLESLRIMTYFYIKLSGVGGLPGDSAILASLFANYGSSQGLWQNQFTQTQTIHLLGQPLEGGTSDLQDASVSENMRDLEDAYQFEVSAKVSCNIVYVCVCVSCVHVSADDAESLSA